MFVQQVNDSVRSCSEVAIIDSLEEGFVEWDEECGVLPLQQTCFGPVNHYVVG